MRTYEMGLLRQSQALAEAVQRGLLPPLQSCAWSSGFSLQFVKQPLAQIHG